MFDLSGKVAIVTGSSRGLGKSIAEGLESMGATVHRFERSDGNDVTDENSIFKFVEKLEKVDVLVNNAGVTGKSWDETLAVNLKAPFMFSEHAKKKMTSGSSIINISSINAVQGFPGNPSYVSSKHGINGLTKALAVDYAHLGIRVNGIGPGYFRTDMTSKSWNTRNDLIKNHTLLKRWGSSEDIKGPVVFLASDASSYMTGQIIYVDGGWLSNGLVVNG
jgi:NAD(P)-dependent dehydrogenase (short-subunit alcohol dehydrogenase family)